MIPSHNKKMRLRHELAEKIRQLSKGIGLKSGRSKKFESSNFIDIKQEEKHVVCILLTAEHQDLRRITFHQPVVISGKAGKFHNKTVSYQIPRIETKPEGKLEIYPALVPSKRKMKVKRKRKRSTTFSKIEELLSKGKDILLLPEPSEESIVVDVKEEPEHIPMRNIIHLPEDILQRIFWYFGLRERCTILSRVCKTWYYILKNPVFWQHLEFDGDKVPTNTIIDLITGSPLLSSLKLVAVPKASIILQELCRENTGMKELAVRYCVMNRIDCVFVLVQVINSLPNLQVLDLKGTEFQSKRFFTELCLMRNLRSLDLGANRYLHPRDLMTVSINCRNLETLKILDIPWDSAGNGKLTDENFSFVIKNLHNSITHLEHDMQKLGNAAYLAILQCKKLKTLCLTNCLLLTGEMFRRFGHLEQLKELSLTLAINLSSEDFKDLFAGGKLKKMEYLNISGCWRISKEDATEIQNFLPLSIAHTEIAAGNLPVAAVVAKRPHSSTPSQKMFETELKLEQLNLFPKRDVHLNN